MLDVIQNTTALDKLEPSSMHWVPIWAGAHLPTKVHPQRVEPKCSTTAPQCKPKHRKWGGLGAHSQGTLLIQLNPM